MTKSTFWICLVSALAAASGCREPCGANEVRSGDDCVLWPDSGSDAGQPGGDVGDGGIDPGSEDDPSDEDAGADLGPVLDPSFDDAGERDAETEHPPDAGPASGACPTCSRRRAKDIAYGAPGCAILDDGTLWCWGGAEGSRVPKQVGTWDDWQAISSTANIGDELSRSTLGNHTCGIRSGALYCWGENFDGQLGLGSEEPNMPTPQRVGEASDWTAVSTSALVVSVSCGIRAGALYCWGGSRSIAAPMRIGTRSDWSWVSAGTVHSCGVAGGSVTCWWSNDGSFREEVGDWTDWTLVSTSDDGSFSCGIRLGKLFCWGANPYGQLGQGVASLNKRFDAPVQVGTSEDWTSVDTSVAQTCGIRGGELYCWGASRMREASGATALESVNAFPRRVGKETDWRAVSVGTYGACARRESGEVWCWGFNAHGELGTDDVATAWTGVPSQVGDADDWVRVAAGPTSTCALQNGQLFCWGTMQQSKADGTSTQISRTFLPTRIGSSTSWTALAMHANAEHACGINSNSTWCWGAAAKGQLGSSSVPSLEPTKVESAVFDDWPSHLVVKRDTSCMLDSSGVYCWGDGWPGISKVADSGAGTWSGLGVTIGIRNGQLVEWSSTTPVINSKLSLEKDWTAIEQSQTHTCGIRAGGQLYCWGENALGQLGLGVGKVNVTQSSPQRVPGSSPWLAVSLAGHSTCALQADKSLWCWGVQAEQLPNDMPAIDPDPVKVAGQWEAVALGGEHTCAIASDGTLWCWGANRAGQCGVGDYWTDELQLVELPQ